MEGSPPTDDLRQQLAALDRRVQRLEQLLERVQLVVPPVVPPAVPPTPVPARETLRVTVPVPPAPQPRRSWREVWFPKSATRGTRDTDTSSLEGRIGSHLFNRVGIFALLVGMAWFLKFAFDNHWIGPAGRVIIGLLAGIGLILWSERFRARDYTAFSFSLKAVGSGMLYLSLWAAYDLYHLIPAGLAFVAMILVTAWNGFMCWAQNSELLAWYALLGGFLTPVLTSTGENHQIVLNGYLLALDAAVVTLVVLRPWSRLLLGAFIGTAFLLIGWASQFYTRDALALTACFTTLFVLLFAWVPLRMRIPSAAAKGDAADHARQIGATIAYATSGAGFLAFYAMLAYDGYRWARPWMAVAFAALSLVLLRLLVRNAQTTERIADHRTSLLSAIHLTLTVAFIAVAIALEFDGYWVSTGWLVEGAALLWVAHRFRHTLLRQLGVCALLLGAIVLLLTSSPATEILFLNERFAAFLVGIAAFAYTVWIARNAMRETPQGQPQETAPAETSPKRSAISTPISTLADLLAWPYIAVGAAIVVTILTLVAGNREIHAFWTIREAWSRMYEQFSYSVWWMVLGGVLLALGFWKRVALLRWQAIVLLTLSIGKVFLVDSSELRQGYRILSFLGLGVLLLAISFVYQRDWFQLRQKSSSHPQEPSHE